MQRLQSKLVATRVLSFSLALLVWCGPELQGSPRAAEAGVTQVALFTGFNAGANAGMDILNALLSTSAVPEYVGMVFQWTEGESAFDWIQQFADQRSTLVLIGHSFGGNTALQVAENNLKPVGVDVDLTIQVDSVANFGSGANDVLPSNVDTGMNYYQIATGFFEPQGERNVLGASNVNVEVLFNDTSITHTSIDNDPRLHQRIEQDILENLNRYHADFDGSGVVDGADFLLWQRGLSPAPFSESDLQLWQGQIGAVAAWPASGAIPEPSALVLLAAGWCGALLIGCIEIRRPNLH